MDLSLYDNISSNSKANVSFNVNSSIYGNASALSGTESSHVVDEAFSTDTSRNPETAHYLQLTNATCLEEVDLRKKFHIDSDKSQSLRPTPPHASKLAVSHLGKT